MRSLKIAAALGAVAYCATVAFGAGCSSKDAAGSTGSAGAKSKAKTAAPKTTTKPKTPPAKTSPTMKAPKPAQPKPAAPTPKKPASMMMVAKGSDKAKTNGDKSTVTCSDLGLTDGQAFCYYDDAGENYVIFCSGTDAYSDWCGNYEPDPNTFAACLNVDGLVDCFPQPLDPVAAEIFGDTDSLNITNEPEGFASGVHCPTFFEGKGVCDDEAMIFCKGKDLYSYNCGTVYSVYTKCQKDAAGSIDCCLADGSDCIHSGGTTATATSSSTGG